MREVIGSVARLALLGLCWGVVARAWMRFISTSPEFSWAGTAYIVAAPTIIGALAGLAYAARRRQWRRAWLPRSLGAGSMVLLGVGAGSVMVPTLLLGTLAAARSDWPRWARATLAALALVPVIAALAEPWVFLDSVRAPIAVLAYIGLLGVMILILRVSLAPEPSPAERSSTPGARVLAAG